MLNGSLIILFLKKSFLVKRSSENAVTAMRATVGSDGYDLYSVVYKLLCPFKTGLIKTGFHLTTASGFYGKIVGRSGLALFCIWTQVGTLDSDFCGNVSVILTNISCTDYLIKKGDHIGQIIFEKYKFVKLSECSINEELSKTDRGLSVLVLQVNKILFKVFFLIFFLIVLLAKVIAKFILYSWWIWKNLVFS